MSSIRSISHSFSTIFAALALLLVTSLPQASAQVSFCDTLLTEWENPTLTTTFYGAGVNALTDYITGVPDNVFTLDADAGKGIYERYPTPNPGVSKVSAVRVGLGNLWDPSDNMVFRVILLNDDGSGAPGLAIASSQVLSPTQLGVPGQASFANLWIELTTLPSISTPFFHVGVEIFQGDANDELVVVSSSDGEGNGDGSNHILTATSGFLNIQNDFGIYNLNIDLGIIPLVGDSLNSSFTYPHSAYLSTDADPLPLIVGSAAGSFSSIPAGLAINSSTGLIDLSASLEGIYVITYQVAGSCPTSIALQVNCGGSTMVTNTQDAGCGSLRQVVRDAAPGDTIKFDPALDGDTIFLTTEHIEIDKNLVILGNDSSKTIIDGSAHSRIFKIENGEVSIANLSVQNGISHTGNPIDRVEKDGGGIWNESSDTVRITDCAIRNNHATENGGGIFNDGGILILTNSCLLENKADYGAGLNSSLTAVISGTLINENEADISGGGLWNSATGTMSISGGEISDNTARGNSMVDGGGGIFNDGGTVSLNNFSKVIENKSNGTSGSGGGIFSNGGTFNILSGNVNGNSANRSGGGIEIKNGTLNIVGITSLSDNDVNGGAGTPNPGVGGGLSVSGISLVNLNSLTFVKDNSAALQGGGIWNDAGSTINLIDMEVRGNAAHGSTTTDGGGGIYNNGGSISIYQSAVNENTADGTNAWGGGIYSTTGGMLTISNSTLSGNYSKGSGGGIYNSGDLELESATIADNETGNNGGGIAQGVASTANTIFHNTIVATNTAANNGQDIYKGVGFFTSNNHNLIGEDDQNHFAAQPNDVVGAGGSPVDPGLGPLSPFFGPYFPSLHPLLCGSPALNAGMADSLTDQDNRARGFGSADDIGAFESQETFLPGSKIVANSNDSGPGSLRQTILDACPGDTLKFDASTNGDTIILTSGQILLEKNIVIMGNGMENTFIDGNKSSRIFETSATTDPVVSIMQLTIQDGNPNTLGSRGGGIYNQSIGKLSLYLCHFTRNYAIYGGGIFSLGDTLEVNNCTFSYNSANKGGGLNNNFTALISQSTFVGNYAGNGGGIYYEQGQITLVNSTLSENTAILGGGVMQDDGTFTSLNSTISGNSVSSGGGGIYIYDGTSIIHNTIVAGNTASGTGPDGYVILGSINSASSNNLVGIDFSVLLGSTCPAGNNNQIGTSASPIDPLLGPLADNGGPTQTHALLCGSPAYNTGNTSESLDQRGQARGAFGADDIGAFESQVDLSIVAGLVTNASDDGCGSLRQAVANASPGDTVRFDSSIDGDTIILTSGQILLEKDIVIMGNGMENTFIDGNKSSRIFETSGATNPVVSIMHLTIQDGAEVSHGGGIQILSSGQFTLAHCKITRCSATGLGGGVEIAHGNTHILNCIFSHNYSAVHGGAISFSYAGSPAGAVLLVENSTIKENTAFSEGGGVRLFSGSLIMNYCTVIGNTSASDGGIFSSGPFLINNCTISNNTASQYGGGGVGVAFRDGTITNSTIVNNSAVLGGGVYSNYNEITIHNTILAGNTATGTGPDGAIGSSGTITGTSNLIGDNTDFGMPAGNNNQIGTSANPIDPRLGPLADNGGPTQTHALLPGSPALNAGNDALAPLTDQRGFPRVGISDIGSFELQCALTNSTLMVTVCSSFVTPSGKVLMSTGVYSDTIPNARGCDSVITINLTVSPLQVVSFDLVQAGTGGIIAPLTEGYVINKAAIIGNFSVVANVCSQPVGSVVFNLNGVNVQTESQSPYAINGDNPRFDYTPWKPAAGSYTLIATPYTNGGGNGVPGVPDTIHFSVVDNGPVFDCNGDLNGTAYINGCDSCVGGNTGRADDYGKDDCDVCNGNNANKDCHGDCFGTALVDGCGDCTGGLTGLVANSGCNIDCNGDLNGTATVDDCNVCSGGLTGVTPNADKDACGVCFGDGSSCAPCVPLEVVSLTLVNLSGNDIVKLANGYVIDKSTAGSFSVRADVCDQPSIGSVRFFLNGSFLQNENTAPYAIKGDNSAGYKRWNPAAGTYTIEARPYSGGNGKGTVGVSETVTVTVVDQALTLDCAGVLGGTAFYDGCNQCVGGTTGLLAGFAKDDCEVCFGNNADKDSCGVCFGLGLSCVGCDPMEVTGLTLMNAGTAGPIRMLNAQDTIIKSQQGNFSVRADVCATSSMESVRFFLSGSLIQNENVAPYSIAGDGGGSFNTWNIAAGHYILTAVPYSGKNGNGTPGTSATVDLWILNSAPAASMANNGSGDPTEKPANERTAEDGTGNTQSGTATASETDFSLTVEGLALRLFPNPTSGKLTVETENAAADSELMLLDMSGKLLRTVSQAKVSGAHRTYSLDLSTLPKGIYLVKLRSGSEIRTKRVVRE